MFSDIATMLNFIGAIILAFLCGAITVLLIVLYLVHKYSKHLPIFDKKTKVEYEKPLLGGILHHSLHNGRGVSTLGEKESCSFINVLFAFIFREWRDTNQLQKWVLKKINIEFMEFMETKTASRLLEGLKVHDVSLGTNFPVFHSATIKDPFSFSGNDLPELVTLELDMEYHGGFFLAIDVDLVFGKTAFLAVKITYLKGKVRLQFGRQPCTHWSISFVEEPDVKFHVETSFETRQLPQLTSLIVNQIRRTLRRKHTLPHYKMRYNPFFSFQHPEVSPFEGFISELPVQPSVMEVCVAACTRLLISSRGEKERYADSPNFVVFATISVNVESCIGKALLGHVAIINTSAKTESSEAGTSALQNSNTPSTSRATPQPTIKSSSTTFDTFQRSFLGLRKDAADRGRRVQPKKSQEAVLQKEEVPIKKKIIETTPKSEIPDEDKARNSSVSSTSSNSSGPSYVMVALNFGATLREETKDGAKSVIVENITEHNVHGQSGMKDGDTVVELNGVRITSLSQVIATIEGIRASKQSFKFKVKRDRPVLPDNLDLDENAALADSDKSTASSIETESDHSDVDLEDYKDFVNISLQFAEFQMKNGSGDRRSNSMKEKDKKPEQRAKGGGSTRPHSSSVSAAAEGTVDAPYMTLVSAPTPSTSLTSLKGSSSSLKESSSISSITKSIESALKSDVKKEKVTKKKDFTKMIGARSRSESPPFMRKFNTMPKGSSTPMKRHSKSKEMPRKEAKKKTDPTHKRSLTSFSALGAGSPSVTSKLTPTSSDVPDHAQGTSRKSENLSFARVDDDPSAQLFKTSLVNSNQHEYSWKNEKFNFNIKEGHRYLNIRYWSQQIGKQGILKNKATQIVGCVSIPICELEMCCRGVTSRRVTRRYPLSNPNELPNDHKWFLSDPVSSRSSFREDYCFGDTTLTVSLQPNPGNKNNSSNQPRDPAGTFYPEGETNEMISKEILSRISRQTGSDYLLSAATEKGRKLLVSRQTQTAVAKEDTGQDTTETQDTCQVEEPTTVTDDKEDLIKDKLSLSQFIRGIIHGRKDSNDMPKENPEPGIVSIPLPKESENQNTSKRDEKRKGMTAVEENQDKSGLHQFEPAKFTTSIKCAFCHNKVWTKSGLRCKCCSTVCHKRCVEKFKSNERCPGSKIDEISIDKREDSGVVVEEDTDSSDNNSTAPPSMAMNFRNKMLGMSSKQDENSNSVQFKKKSRTAEDLLAINAKEMGKDLHRDLPLSERKTMLENQMLKVETELHCEIEEKENLLKEQGLASVASREWKKIERKICKSDERLQALALLLLHYRAGLEDCEFEEEQTIVSTDNAVDTDSRILSPNDVVSVDEEEIKIECATTSHS